MIPTLQLGQFGRRVLPPLPLDKGTFAAGWSVARRLRTAYTGPLIRIRRSSDNTEQDIGYTGANVLNTDAIASFVGANSAYVKTIYDQTGNSRILTQTSNSLQPRIVNAGTLDTQNGKPCAVFNGTTHWMLNSVSDPISTGSDVYWFHVGEVGIGRGGTDWSIAMLPTTHRMVLTNGGVAQYNLTLSGTAFAQYTYVIDQGGSTTDHFARKNGATVDSATAIAKISLRTPSVLQYTTVGQLFGSLYYAGPFCESAVFTFAGGMGNVDRDALELDQRKFYGT
jgi:hypothetical protein